MRWLIRPTALPALLTPVLLTGLFVGTSAAFGQGLERIDYTQYHRSRLSGATSPSRSLAGAKKGKPSLTQSLPGAGLPRDFHKQGQAAGRVAGRKGATGVATIGGKSPNQIAAPKLPPVNQGYTPRPLFDGRSGGGIY